MSWPINNRKLGVGLLTVLSLNGLTGCVIAPIEPVHLSVTPEPAQGVAVSMMPVAPGYFSATPGYLPGWSIPGVATPWSNGVYQPAANGFASGSSGYAPYAQYPAPVSVPATNFR